MVMAPGCARGNRPRLCLETRSCCRRAGRLPARRPPRQRTREVAGPPVVARGAPRVSPRLERAQAVRAGGVEPKERAVLEEDVEGQAAAGVGGQGRGTG